MSFGRVMKMMKLWWDKGEAQLQIERENDFVVLHFVVRWREFRFGG